MTETIFALSSGSVPSGVAVMRLSGPQALPIAGKIAGPLPPARQMALRVFSALDGGVIDRGLFVCFPAPSSATGEDCAEFHIHGSRAVVAALSDALRAAGAAAAQAGDFTRRAFVNGKLDLVEVEALAELLEAETEAQRRMAVEHGSGRLSGLYQSWTGQALQARALAEAAIDFSDEADVSLSAFEDARRIAAELVRSIREHLRRAEGSEIVQEGLKVAIVGAPNAGKSSLINYLAGRDVAIVSDEAGTTRDILSAVLDLDGFKIVLHDTAGLRPETASAVERIGMERAQALAGGSQLVLHLIAPGQPDGISLAPTGRTVRIGSKLDIGSAHNVEFGISTRTGEGIDRLFEILAAEAESRSMGAGTAPFRERQITLLEQAAAALEFAAGLDEMELSAERLRLAGDCLGRITGRFGVEDVLGAIFSSFCIGK